MRKLKVIEHISLDGVIQHSADDDDFPYSDWTAPYRTPAGRDLFLSGSSTLTSMVLEHGPADDVVLIVSPVLLGTGKRFFAEGTPAHSLVLVSTQATQSGVILNTYKVAGPLKAG
ncbi:MAG: dihydrofolate reductase family protein [Burkholderiales bacterium]